MEVLMNAYTKLRTFLTKPVNRIESIVITVLLVPILAAAVTSAATTISTDISTGGNLSVMGTTTLMGNVGVGITSSPEDIFRVEGQNQTGGLNRLEFDGDSSTGYNRFAIYTHDVGGDEFGHADMYLNPEEGFSVSASNDGGSIATSINLTRAGFTLSNETVGIFYFLGGKIGIASSSPSELLSVQGNTYLDGNLTVTGTTNGLKIYRALLTQIGTDAPVATVLENSLGGTVVWARSNIGQYTGTLSGAFPADKTFLPPLGHLDESPGALSDFFRNNNNSVFLYTTASGGDGGSDGQLSSTPVEILVYP